MVLAQEGADLQVYYRDGAGTPLRPLYSARIREGAAARALNVPLKTGGLFIVPSPLLWYGVPELIARCDSASKLVCIEFEPILAELANRSIPQAVRTDPRVTWLPAASIAEVNDAILALVRHDIRHVRLISLSGGYRLHAHLYKAVEHAAMQHVQFHWQNRLTMLHVGRRWVDNIFKNLAGMHGAPRGVSRQGRSARAVSKGDAERGDWRMLSTRRPVMVIGAGESLEARLDLITALRSRLCVLCVDTALPILRKRNIVPDIVIAVDAQCYNMTDFLIPAVPMMPTVPMVPAAEAEAQREPLLLCDIVSYPGISRWMGQKMFFSSRIDELDLLCRIDQFNLRPPSIPPLGSVGVAAAWFALQFTGAPIFLVGLDFSYPLGKSHARGAPIYTALRRHRLEPDPVLLFGLRRQKMEITDKEGARVFSDLLLRSYAAQLRQLVAPRDNVWDIGMTGLPITSRRCRDEAQICAIIAESEAKPQVTAAAKTAAKTESAEEVPPPYEFLTDAAFKEKLNGAHPEMPGTSGTQTEGTAYTPLPRTIKNCFTHIIEVINEAEKLAGALREERGSASAPASAPTSASQKENRDSLSALIREHRWIVTGFPEISSAVPHPLQPITIRRLQYRLRSYRRMLLHFIRF